MAEGLQRVAQSLRARANTFRGVFRLWISSCCAVVLAALCVVPAAGAQLAAPLPSGGVGLGAVGAHPGPIGSQPRAITCLPRATSGGGVPKGKSASHQFPSLSDCDKAQAARRAMRNSVLVGPLDARFLTPMSGPSSAGIPYAPGDVFEGDWNGFPFVRHYSAGGTLLENLGPSYVNENAVPTGMCADAQGDLYVTMFQDSSVSKFDNAGHLLQRWTQGMINDTPESCIVDGQGHVWVGFATDAPNNGQESGLVEFDSNGNPLATYHPPAEDRGVDWIMLGNDDCTLYYTSEGTLIHRFDVCTGQALSAFAGLPFGSGGCFQLAIRPNGEMMVACNYAVYRLSSTGLILQTYSASSLGINTQYTTPFSIALDVDNKSFWVQQDPWFGSFAFYSGALKVDIASGLVIGHQLAGANATTVSVFGSDGPAGIHGGPLTPSETLGGGNPGEPCLTCQVAQQGGYPVNTATGDFWDTVTDDSIPGRGIPLDLTRTYNSLAASTAGPFGYGWSSSYTLNLTLDPASGNATVHQENGATTTFTAAGGGAFTAPPNAFETLVQNANGSYTFTRRAREIFTFSASGQLLSESDLNGYTTTLSYDGSGNLAAVTDPDGRQLTFSYGSNGKVASVSDPGGRTIQYGYDTAGNLTTVTDTNNGVTQFSYDANHLMTTMIDPDNGTVTNGYDSQGRLTSQRDPLQRQTTYQYTPSQTTITSPKGDVTVQIYDANGELSQETRGYGTSAAATWTYEYDPRTLMIVAVTDPKGHTTTYARDAFGDPTRVSDGLGRTTVTAYNQLGEPTAITGPSGITTTSTYDSAGNLLTVSRPLTSTGETQSITNHYDDSSHPGDITSVTNARGKTTYFTYDGQGDQTKVIDPLGNTSTSAYNVLGQMTSSVTPRGNVTGGNPSLFTTTYTYNGLGELKTLSDPLGHSTAYGHDADGNLTSVTDGDNDTTSYTYDAANELTKITRPDQTTLVYGYDGDGNRTSQTNGANRTTTYGYDPQERLTSVTDPLNRITAIGYDLAGNKTSLTDAAGQTTSYSYDAANELTAITYSGTTPDVGYTYNADGLRQTMVDGTGTTTYGYDSLNRLTSAQNGAGQTVRYGYDLQNDLTSVTYPNGQPVNRVYNDGGQLASVSDWLSNTTQFAYDPDGNLTGETYPNGVGDTSTFDDGDQLSSITDTKGGTTLASFSYTRDGNGQLLSTTTTGLSQPSESYTYNQLNQLTKVNNSSYAYDAADDPTTLGSTGVGYDAASEATSLTLGGTTTPINYDPRGNRLNGIANSVAPINYAYDQANRLTRVQTGTGAASVAGLIAAGSSHTLVVKSDGTVWAWGLNTSGQLGNGNTTNQKSAVQVSGISNAAAVAGGAAHSLALRSTGAVSAWGLNSSGQLGNGSTTSSSTPVSVSGLTNARAVTAGSSHSLALETDGSVVAWGLNSSGQLGNGTTTNSTTPVAVSNLSRVVSIAAGNAQSLALRVDGTVWAWGGNASGQLGNGTTTNSSTPVQVSNLSGVIAIAAGGDDSYALTRSGAVWAWGDDAYGQLGNTSVTKKSTTPVLVSLPSNISAIAAGGFHAFALASDGTVWAWGRNNSGQLGDGQSCGKQSCTTPVHLNSPTGVIALAGGSLHSLAATAAGSLWVWGDNSYGQLGNGNTTTQKTPIQLATPSAIRPGDQPSFTYNGDGLRMTKSSAGATLNYAWDLSGPPQVLTDGSTNYIYGPGGRPVEQIDSSGSASYLLQDQLGSTRMITDPAGNVAGTYNYDAYGNTNGHTGSASTPLRYEGQYEDVETGLYYLRARYYDPASGQFLTPDAFQAVTGAPYVYVADDPLNGTDPLGLCWPSFACPVENAIGGAVSSGWNTTTNAVSTAWNDTGGAALGWAADHPVAVAVGGAAVIGTAACIVLEPCGLAEGVVASDEAAGVVLDEASVEECTAAESIPTSGETPYTVYGKAIHASYDYGPGFEREFTLANNERVDAVNFETREVLELKPNNPKAIRLGLRTAQRYAAQLDKQFPGDRPFTYRVVTYDRP